MTDGREALFSDNLKRALQGYRAEDVVRRFAREAPCDDPISRAQYIDIKTWLPSDILTKVDRTAMANSLEVRVPMLDHTFVNWALGLPSAVNRRGNEGKILLKRAFSRLVPARYPLSAEAGLFRAACPLVPRRHGGIFADETQSEEQIPGRGISQH